MAGKDSKRVARIARLNDQLRRTFTGGRVTITCGIAVLDPPTVQAILTAVQDFQTFTSDNDPWGEHDCAVLTVQGIRIIWKIDYYDPTLTYASSDPADPQQTTRVLTVMLAEEY